eukprot:7768533-Alexandrium_andersonii.AAC.1
MLRGKAPADACVVDEGLQIQAEQTELAEAGGGWTTYTQEEWDQRRQEQEQKWKTLDVHWTESSTKLSALQKDTQSLK